jgi:hypothetical protein
MAAGITRVVAKIGTVNTDSKYQAFTETEDMFRTGGVDYEWL